ncbi:MAG TPA: hypothetical protein PLE60_15355 [Candidatus Latescibacteria bacterium]|nr:hypothetical protein [Candidatus Latescibacterota bacterium]
MNLVRQRAAQRVPQRKNPLGVLAGNQGSAETPKGDPKGTFIGDMEVPWNVGATVWRFKAARDLKILNSTIDCKEIVSPTGAPVVVEAWKNGVYAGDAILKNGANTFPDIPLKRLDEIELRVVVKGDKEGVTAIKGLWILYCVV